ncbi:MAG TPA: PhnD/SsuA/transferrin family substrate-binding protein [Burkholderiales bacterium]|nr:PhnD/SsuA/transferrin family substrate-binding protein [Burkholderiales bacterium]
MRARSLAALWLFTLAAGLVKAAEDPLTLGVFPRNSSAETARQFAPMAAYLHEHLGREVALATSKNFESFWKAISEQRYDIVHYNQYQFIRSAKSYRVIARSQELGRDAVAGALYVRRDSGITEVSQLRGRTIIFGGGRDAMLSYIAPKYLLMQAGLKEGDFRTELAVSPPNALIALYHRQAEAAGGGELLVELPVVRNAIDTQQLKILATTEPLLFLPWAVKRSMSAKLRESIQALLVNLGDNEAGKQVLKAANVTGLKKAEDRDYDPHRKIVAAVLGSESSPKRTHQVKP